ncbi:MAG: M16 family metallopeptidase, partial [Planctomycetota bacterium]
MNSTGAFELPNGMRFIVAEDHACPAAAVGLWAMAGVPDEPADRRGIAHFFEHMMFRGSANVGPEEHSRRIEGLGGRYNAGTGIDATVYHDTVPADGLEEVFRLEADRFRHLTLTDEHLDVERKVVLEELHVYENQPMVKAMRQLNRTIGRDHPYALDPLGRAEDLEAMDREDMEAFYRKCYRPDRVFGVVAGDVTIEQVRRLAERHFGDWQAQEAPAEPVGPFEPLTGQLALRLPFEIPVVAGVHRLAPPAQTDRPALKVLARMLTQGKTSLIQEALVERTHLCVMAGAMMIEGRHGGVLVTFGAFLPPGSHGRRRRVLRDVYSRLTEAGPEPDRLTRCVKQARLGRANEQYDPQRRM